MVTVSSLLSCPKGLDSRRARPQSLSLNVFRLASVSLPWFFTQNQPITSPRHEVTSWLYHLRGKDYHGKQPRKEPWPPAHALAHWYVHLTILQKYCSVSRFELYIWFNHWSSWIPEGKYGRFTIGNLKTVLKETTYTGLAMWHRPKETWRGREKPPECVEGSVAVNCEGTNSHLQILQGGTLGVDAPCPHSSASTENPAGASGQGSVGANRAGQPLGGLTGWRGELPRGGRSGPRPVQQISINIHVYK